MVSGLEPADLSYKENCFNDYYIKDTKIYFGKLKRWKENGDLKGESITRTADNLTGTAAMVHLG
jgi:hypothetical protein